MRCFQNPNSNPNSSTSSVQSALSKTPEEKATNKYASVAERKASFCSSSNFQIVRTSGDGSCQYHSVIQALRHACFVNLPSVKNLRAALADALAQEVAKNNTFYTHQLALLYADAPAHQTFDAFLSGYYLGLRANAFGDDLTLHLMADFFGIHIHVFHPNLRNDIVPEDVYGGVRTTSSNIRGIVRILLMEEHYETLLYANATCQTLGDHNSVSTLRKAHKASTSHDHGVDSTNEVINF